MKNYFTPISMLCSIAIILSSCSASYQSRVDSNNTPIQAKESNAGCFIQKKDGTVQEYTSLKLITGLFISPYLLADNNIKISGSDIKAYQNQDFYAISQDYIESGHRSKVAVEALPGFAIRIAKGKMNIYTKKYFNGAKAVDELFIQSGEEGKIVPYTHKLMTDLVIDHPEMLDILNKEDKDFTLSKRLQAVAEVYNQVHLISKN